jgi:catechol 2,3-dioxygenase-like lactoylglutathione lyase family enzyme/mannose-6-phosphate isomerase-like protein (cupin superfamily)
MGEHAFGLERTFVHLGLGATAVPLPEFRWDPEYVKRYEAEHAGDGDEARLVMIHGGEQSWTSWERHPAGDEVVVLLSGRATLIQEIAGQEERIDLQAGHAAINPKGTWHTADVHGPYQALFITPGRGTEHRPRTGAAVSAGSDPPATSEASANSPMPDQFNLVVSDMEATVAFYRQLGLTIPDTEPAFQFHHRSPKLDGGMDLDFDSVEFAQHWDGGWRGGMGVLGFKVDSRERVDEIYTNLTRAGYHAQQQPYDTFWGARYTVIEDPDGNAVGIMSPIDPDRRSHPGFPGQ